MASQSLLQLWHINRSGDVSIARANARKFAKVLEPCFASVLRGDGFAPQASGWIRVRDPVINWLDVQSRSDDEACCVNLGVHFTFLPVPGRSTGGCVASEIQVASCKISHRLSWEGEQDHWWSYGDAELAANDLVACYEKRGSSLFERYTAFPHPFVDFGPGDVDCEALEEIVPLTEAGKLLFLARLHDYLGNGALAVRFCEIGRETTPKFVSNVRFAFKEILKKYGIQVQGR